jgi:hypothetical protein
MTALRGHPSVRGKRDREAGAAYCTGRQLRRYNERQEARKTKAARPAASIQNSVNKKEIV